MDKLAAGLRRLAPVGVAALALVVVLQAGPASLTAPAQEVAAQPAPGLTGSMRVTDGATVWPDWAPLQVWLATSDPQASHAIQALLWVALALSVLALARELGAAPAGAIAASSLTAAHPVATAAYADAAGRGCLIAALGMTLAVAMALRSVRSRPLGRGLLAGGSGIMGLGAALGEPLGLILPMITAVTQWSVTRAQEEPRPSWRRGLCWEAFLAQIAAAALVVAVRAVLVPEVPVSSETNPAVSSDGQVDPIAAGALTARALRVAVLGAPLVRQPWDVDWSHLGANELPTWLGWCLLLLAPVVARLNRKRPAVASGLFWMWAVLLALSQLAEPMPSAQPPAHLLLVLIGLALALGGLIEHRWALIPALLGAVLLAAFPTRQAAAWFESEEAMLRHELAVAPEAVLPRAALARRHLELGEVPEALQLVERSTVPALVEIRIRALLDLGRWGSAQEILPLAAEDRRLALSCHVAAAAGKVGAVRTCEAARARYPRDPELALAQARALETDRRLVEAEALLRGALAERPSNPRLLATLAAFLERQGWLRQSVEVREAWLAQRPDDREARLGLTQSLARKARGDLLDKRWDEAIQTLVRLLGLAPDDHPMRYYLAEAYRGAGKLAEAEAEVARARAHGAEPPPPPDAVPPPGTGDMLHRHAPHP
jgi:tetratricopeptide (TPR) repeat protein